MNTEIITAISKLNSWVRSPSFRGIWCTSLRRAIYTYKGEMLKQLAGSGAFTWPESIRLIEVDVQCRKCGGTGIYYDTGGGCWDCNGTHGIGRYRNQVRGTGRVQLRFFETTLPAGDDRNNRFIWHTPYMKAPEQLKAQVPTLDEPEFYEDGFQSYYPHYRVACRLDDWQPNTPGVELPLAEAVALLNQVEAWYLPPEGWGYKEPERHTRSRAQTVFSYRLDLGSAPERCARCSSLEVENRHGTGPHRIGTGNRWFHWTTFLCQACDKALSPSEWTRLEDWKELGADPAIEAWLERRLILAPVEQERESLPF